MIVLGALQLKDKAPAKPKESAPEVKTEAKKDSAPKKGAKR